MKIRCSKRKLKWTIILSVFFVAIILYFSAIVNPIILMYSKGQVSSLAAKAINSAIVEVFADYIAYEDFIKVTKDNDGDILLIEANAIEMNKFARNLVRVSQNRLELIGTQGLLVPLGTFTGIPILIGRGPGVKIKIAPVGSIVSSFGSKFQTMGINTTNHKIFITLDVSISIALPVETTLINTSHDVLFVENVIVGKVPLAYLNSDILDRQMNLVP